MGGTVWRRVASLSCECKVTKDSLLLASLSHCCTPWEHPIANCCKGLFLYYQGLGLSVLRTAGSVLRSAQSKDELFLFMRTLRDMNMSKLVFEDIELFISLLGRGTALLLLLFLRQSLLFQLYK